MFSHCPRLSSRADLTFGEGLFPSGQMGRELSGPLVTGSPPKRPAFNHRRDEEGHKRADRSRAKLIECSRISLYL